MPARSAEPARAVHWTFLGAKILVMTRATCLNTLTSLPGQRHTYMTFQRSFPYQRQQLCKPISDNANSIFALRRPRLQPTMLTWEEFTAMRDERKLEPANAGRKGISQTEEQL